MNRSTRFQEIGNLWPSDSKGIVQKPIVVTQPVVPAVEEKPNKIEVGLGNVSFHQIPSHVVWILAGSMIVMSVSGLICAYFSATASWNAKKVISKLEKLLLEALQKAAQK